MSDGLRWHGSSVRPCTVQEAVLRADVDRDGDAADPHHEHRSRRSRCPVTRPRSPTVTGCRRERRNLAVPPIDSCRPRVHISRPSTPQEPGLLRPDHPLEGK